MEDALKLWLDLNLMAENITQSLFNASTLLSKVVSQPSLVPKNAQGMGDIINRLRTHNQTVEKTMQQLAACHHTVNNVVNQLIGMRPPSELPDLVLRHIFELANAPTYCVADRQSTDPLIVIPSVCKRWRQLALETKSLWSHIDIDLSRYDRVSLDDDPFITTSSGSVVHTPYRYQPRKTFLWLERACEAPLELHFRHVTGSAVAVRDMVQLLEPHASQITSLVFSDVILGTFPQTILTLCKQHGSPGGVKKFILHGGLYVSDENRFALMSSSLRDLTVLQLRLLYARLLMPTINQVVKILARSPSLCVLQLNGMDIAMGRLGDVTPVTLPHLQYFDIANLDKEAFVHLLSILYVGELDVHMMIHISTDPEVLAATNNFFQRANILSLGIQESRDGDQIHSVDQHLAFLPRLQSLFFDMGWDNGPRLGSLLRLGDNKDHICRWPTLQRLFLYGGVFDQPTQSQMKKVVQTFSLAQVSLIYNVDFRDRTGDEHLNNFGLAEKKGDGGGLVEWLKQKVAKVSVECVDVGRNQDQGLEFSHFMEHLGNSWRCNVRT